MTPRSRPSPTRLTTPRPTATPRTTPRSCAAWGNLTRSTTRASTRRSAASTWNVPRACPVRASATSSAMPPSSRWRSTSSHSITSRRPASRPSSLPSSSARRRCTGPGLPNRALEHLLARGGRALPHRDVGGRAPALHSGENLEKLPLRYTGSRPASAARRRCRPGHPRYVPRAPVQQGRDVVFVEPETSWDEHERLLDLEEQFFRALGLPYRVMNVAAGDLGASAAKKYDIEAWFPFQERYREVTSCSNTTDYQSRASASATAAAGGLRTRTP